MPILRSQRTRQPSQPVPIDWGNPITAGLNWLVLGGQLIDLTAKSPPFTTGGTAPVIAYGQDGRAWQFSTGRIIVPSTNITTKIDGGVTLFARFLRTGSGTNQQLIRANNSATRGFLLRLNDFGLDRFISVQASTVSAQISGTLAANTWHSMCGIARDNVAVELYRNGSLANSSALGVAVTDNSTSVTIGQRDDGVESFDGLISIAARWSRPLSPGEVASLHANPWQLFIPSRRLWAFEAGAAGTHDATGSLSNAGGALSGTASSATARTASGALSGAGGAISGTAARTRAHPSSGALANPGGQLSGSATRAAPGNHPSVGALTNPGATLTGSAARVGSHPSTGVLSGVGGVLTGSAARVAAPVTHDASGALTNPGAVLVGFATNESGVVTDTHDGFWAREYRKMLEWSKKKPTLEEVVEYVEDKPEEALEVAKQVAPVAVSRIDTTELRNNTQTAEFVAQQLMVAIELRRVQIEREADEDDIESILLLM